MNLELFLAGAVVFVWFLGGYSITGFIENGNDEELSYNQTIKIYLIWPYIPIKNFFSALIHYG